MGNCTNTKSHASLKRSYQICPDDISSFDKNSQDKKQFEGHLTNVKIQSLSESLTHKSFGIRFMIQNVINIQYPITQPADGKIKWKKDKSFSLAINDYQMRANLLKVIITGEDGNKQAQLKINLYRILSGPYHHDFNIGKSKIGGRLIFDLKISQLVLLKLEVSRLNANLEKQYPGDRFNFVVESNSNQSFDRQKHKQKAIVKSQASYPYVVPLEKNQKYRLISQMDQAPSPTLRLKRKASNLIKVETSSSLFWSKQQRDQMPFLKLKIKSSELLSCIFYLKIYKFVDERRFTQFSQFSFTFSQMISRPPNQNVITLQETRSVKIDKNLTYNGKKVGTCSLDVSLSFTKFINQIPNCTQTQDGVVNMTHIQLYKIEALSQLKQYVALESSLNRILKLKQQLEIGDDIAQMSKLNHTIARELQNMNQQFARHWRNSFAFQNQKSKKLKDRKILLIRILKLFANLIGQNNDITLSQICWKNVVCIVRRGEMLLKYWYFSEQQTRSLQQGIPNSETKQKIQLGLDCMRTLYHLLELALNTEIQCTFNEEKQQCQVFKAYCFFRIPLFRKKFLLAVEQNLKKSELILEKFGIKQNEYMADSLEVIPSEIDWENKFFRPLLYTQRGLQIQKQLSNILQQHQWFNVIVDQNQIYCNFLRYLIAKFSVLKDIIKLPRWNYFIGYSLLVKELFRIMCITQLGLYENYLIFTAMSLLENEKLSAPMIKILYRKTNLHDQSLVLKLIHILSHFFHVLAKNRKTLSNFPYTYLMKGIKYILESDCSIGVSHSIIFLYNHYEKFDLSFRYELDLYLLGKLFWKMFFNWSFNTRRVYYHMIILRIAQDTELLDATDIKQRLHTCCRIAANGQICYEQKRNKQISNSNMEKILHKQMKNKLKNKIINKQEIDSLKYIKLLENKFSLQQLIKTNETMEYIQIPNYSQTIGVQVNDQNSNILMNQNLNRPSQYDNVSSLKSPILKRRKSLLDYKFIYNCFTQEDFQIPEINSSIDQYFECSAKQFKEILKLLQQHCEKTSCLPQIDLGFKIQIDQKEILPAQFDQINFR